MSEFIVNWPSPAELKRIRDDMLHAEKGGKPDPTPMMRRKHAKSTQPDPNAGPQRVPRRPDVAIADRPDVQEFTPHQINERGRPVQKLQFVPTDPEPIVVRDLPNFRNYWRCGFLWARQAKKTMARTIGGGMCGPAPSQTTDLAAKCLAQANYCLEMLCDDRKAQAWMRMYDRLIRSAHVMCAQEGEGFAALNRDARVVDADGESADDIAAAIEKEFAPE